MIIKKTIKQRVLALVLPVFVAMMFSFSAEAASSCKGMSQSSCSAASDCSWVSGYKRKDGVQVSGHCRAASGKASTKKTQKKSDNKKSGDKNSKK